MKSNVSLQGKLAKQNEISRQRLSQELENLEKVEKSELKMLDTTMHRFRARHRNLDAKAMSSVSNAINVRMYETHNPGFCYHCTGAIKECGTAVDQQLSKDSYEFVRSIVFTKDEVDLHKVLCLHLLTAHSTKWNNNDYTNIKPASSLMEKAMDKHFSGTWNNVLPCYVLDTEAASLPENLKLHEDPRKQMLEDQAMREFEDKYRQYMATNDDFNKTLSSNNKQNKITLQGLEKLPSISPHVYSLLGPSHELRIKQALAEGVNRNRFSRYSAASSGIDEGSISFRLDDDNLSRVTTSTRNWLGRSASAAKRSSFKFDHGLTMLKRSKPTDQMSYRPKHDIATNLIAINSSFRIMKDALSKTSSTKSPYRRISDKWSSANSVLSWCPESATKQFRKCVYLNAPITSIELEDKDHAILPILVNYQVQALVQTVLEVLERVNPEKLMMIISAARDVKQIRKILLRPEIQQFVQSLVDQSLLTSPESFVISVATVVDEISIKFEGIPEKDIVALTLELPVIPCLDALVAEIRKNIFVDARKKSRAKKTSKEEIPNLNESNLEQNVADGSNKAGGTSKAESSNEAGGLSKAESSTEAGGTNKAESSNKESPKSKKKPSKKRKCCDVKTLKHLKKPVIRTYENLSEKTDWVRNNMGKRQSDSTGRGMRQNSRTNAEQEEVPGELTVKHASNSKCWKAAQDPGHLDADHVILQRMTNAQRILVGQMCASLKSNRINNQGLINESVPLAALITPALSRDSIKILTRGTVYSKTNTQNMQPEEIEDHLNAPDKLTGPLLAKIRQEIAESETKTRLKCFLKMET